MLKSFTLKSSPLYDQDIEVKSQGQKLKSRFIIQNTGSHELKLQQLSLEIDFDCSIVRWRDFNYKWVDTSERRIANYYSPKCLVLDNDYKVVGGETIGTWEFDPKFPNKLKWIIHDQLLTPVVQYDTNNQVSWLINEWELADSFELSLLYTKNTFPEFSRSPIPFSAILAFTDHCDFDTELLVKEQRKLFKKYNIQVTKGFFLNHYSKRPDNFSWERGAEELKKWIDDGHELCFHSLTQSIRCSDKNALTELKNGLHEGITCKTWIDHGYQPYNFTKFCKVGINQEEWAGLMKNGGIENLWNYLDTGTSGNDLVNQLDYRAFRLGNYLKSASKLKGRIGMLFFIRSYFLYFASVRSKKAYAAFTKAVKNRNKEKKLEGIFAIIQTSLVLCFSFLSFLKWRSLKQQIAIWGKYAPVIFKFKINGESFNVFQTIEVHDFPVTFSSDNLKRFVNDHGVCLAHTYFSVLDDHLPGRLFRNKDGNLLPEIEDVFMNLNHLVDQEQLWIGKISDVADYFSQFNSICYDIDADGNIVHNIPLGKSNLHIRFSE